MTKIFEKFSRRKAKQLVIIAGQVAKLSGVETVDDKVFLTCLP